MEHASEFLGGGEGDLNVAADLPEVWARFCHRRAEAAVCFVCQELLDEVRNDQNFFRVS
jgi:hypothetical protein